MNKDISLLNRVEIPEPCPMKWSEMDGGREVRFCAKCQKHVYNLSAMTRNEAERVITTHTGELCGQIRRRADGSVMTRWEPKVAARWPRWMKMCFATMVWSISTVMHGCTTGKVAPRGGSIATQPEAREPKPSVESMPTSTNQ